MTVCLLPRCSRLFAVRHVRSRASLLRSTVRQPSASKQATRSFAAQSTNRSWPVRPRRQTGAVQNPQAWRDSSDSRHRCSRGCHAHQRAPRRVAGGRSPARRAGGKHSTDSPRGHPCTGHRPRARRRHCSSTNSARLCALRSSRAIPTQRVPNAGAVLQKAAMEVIRRSDGASFLIAGLRGFLRICVLVNTSASASMRWSSSRRRPFTFAAKGVVNAFSRSGRRRRRPFVPGSRCVATARVLRFSSTRAGVRSRGTASNTSSPSTSLWPQ
jgi:hypothetical protein